MKSIYVCIHSVEHILYQSNAFEEIKKKKDRQIE